MEIDSESLEKTGCISCVNCGWILAVPGKFKEEVVNVGKKAKRVGEVDPRRIIHSAKVGLALTIVSLLYYFRPLYDGFGQSGMWAIITVVVVFEFTVGGTLSKCLNRGFATLIAGSLGIAAVYLANICGERGKPVVLAFLVFVLAAVSTFIRFFPHIKKRYDYGVVIFILTFSLVTVSGYRVEQVVQLAHQRISTVLIGAATCVIISIFFCPVWGGEDLHNLIASNIEKLASCLEGLGCENSSLVHQDEKLIPRNYRSVLNTKATEESLANFAWWEPGHGSFTFSHPWRQYLKIGVLTRECAYQLEALSCCRISEPEPEPEPEVVLDENKNKLNQKKKEEEEKTNILGVKIIVLRIRDINLQEKNKCHTYPCKILTENAMELLRARKEIRSEIREPCIRMSSEVGKALKELSGAVKAMTHPPSSTVPTHLQNSKSAAEGLTGILQALSLEKREGIFVEIMQAVAIASILVEIIKCVERMWESVLELSKQVNFKCCPTPEPENHQHDKTRLLLGGGGGYGHGKLKQVDGVEDEQIVIVVLGTSHSDTQDAAGE